MIAQKTNATCVILPLDDAISTWSFDTNHDSTSQLSETSASLQESVADLRQQIAILHSTIVDLQNAVAATTTTASTERSHGVAWPQQISLSFYHYIFGGNLATTNWNILQWYDLLLLISVIIVCTFVLGATGYGFIEPRDDIKITEALCILFIGGILSRASYLIKMVRRHYLAIQH